MTKRAWFASWFDSPYYHLLYSNRDETEAFDFIDRLINHLSPTEGAYALDLACGKGRHARRLADHQLRVTGIDLSENNISEASRYEAPNLAFHVHDMRLVFKQNYFDYIFNFFTSFGYFEHEADNQRCISAVAASLRTGGTFVIDFMNAEKVVANLVPSEIQRRGAVDFNISKHYTGSHIVKSIHFEEHGVAHSYKEVVQALKLDDFKNYFKHAGLEITAIFGDYQLGDFSVTESDRLILHCTKAG